MELLILTRIVGFVFCATAVLKAVHSALFAHQISQYAPKLKGFRQIAVSVIGLEWFLGIALLLGWQRWGVVPITLLTLVAFSLLTAWALYHKKIEDCGCYGSLFSIHPRYSILLNLIYFIVLEIDYFWSSFSLQESNLKGVIIGGTTAMVVVVARASRRGPLMDISLTRPGRRWKQSWVHSILLNGVQGSYLLVFLGEDCPYCKRWIPGLNILNVQANSPQVIGILASAPDRVEAFAEEHGALFPVVSMKSQLFYRMATRSPTAVLIVDGKVQKKWIGRLPEDYIQRIDAFYQSLPPVVGHQENSSSLFQG